MDIKHGWNWLRGYFKSSAVDLNTIFDDIYEVYDTLGLEAARQVLIKEFTDVFKFSGAYVNQDTSIC